MMNGTGVVSFLVSLGVLTKEEAHSVLEGQIDPLVQLMLNKRALRLEDVEKASNILRSMVRTTNHLKSMQLQMSLIDLVMGKLNHRMDVSREKARESKEKESSGNFPAVLASVE
jgi:hypothetical protein